MDLFLTFACNQADHSVLKEIRNCISSGIYNIFYPNYFNFTHAVQKEINTVSVVFLMVIILGFFFQETKKMKLITYNKKHSFVKIPMNLTNECKYILVDIKLK